MVLQRGQFYGFNGYKVPTRPRGSRSARGKRSFSKNVEESKMRAFEILATLAGKLLLEKEAPTLAVNSNAKHELQGEEKQLKVELCDQGSCDEGTLTPNSHCQWLAQKIKLRECLQTSTSVVLQPVNVIVKSEVPEKIAYKPVLTVVDQSKNGVRLPFETHSPDSAESHVTKAEDGTHAPLQELLTTGNDIDGTVTDLFCLEDPMDLDFKPPNLVTSDSSIGAPTDHSNPNNQDDIGVVDRDDDENSSRCTPPSTVTPKASRPQRIGDRRIRKLLASKFWKIGPTLLRDGESSNNDAEAKPIFRSRRMCYTRRRTQRSTFSRRRLFERSSMGTFDESITDATFKLPEKDTKGEARIAALSMRGGQKPQLKSEDYRVKIGIRSIKVPELFIEMPETATVGELKRTVLETVTSMLRNGLRVGVILQGKKVRDDSKTLRQAGICSGVKPDSVGFSLELNSTQVLQQLINPEKPPILQQCDPYEPLSCLPASDSGVSDAIPNPTDPQVTEPMDHAQSDQNVVIHSGPSATPLSSPDKSTSNSKALVPVPSVSAESMALAPLHRKSRRPELAQRRIRRPFLVSEVEALVQAVEMLGTGRWRDVKLQAFENAKHRTYVDLKDKWKTLVHTARISPQQRRGEPVPQELLDRVLDAHAYWSQQQAKLQGNKQQTEQGMLL